MCTLPARCVQPFRDDDLAAILSPGTAAPAAVAPLPWGGAAGGRGTFGGGAQRGARDADVGLGGVLRAPQLPPADGAGGGANPALGWWETVPAPRAAAGAARRVTFDAGTELARDASLAAAAPRSSSGSSSSTSLAPRGSDDGGGGGDPGSAATTVATSSSYAPSFASSLSYAGGERQPLQLQSPLLGIAAAGSSGSGVGGVGGGVLGQFGRRLTGAGTPAPFGFGRRRFGLDAATPSLPLPAAGEAVATTPSEPPATAAAGDVGDADAAVGAAQGGGALGLPPRSELRRRVAYASRTPFALPATPGSLASSPGGRFRMSVTDSGGGWASAGASGAGGRSIVIEGPGWASSSGGGGGSGGWLATRPAATTPASTAAGPTPSRALFSGGGSGVGGLATTLGQPPADHPTAAPSIYRQAPRRSRGWCARVCGYLLAQ